MSDLTKQLEEALKSTDTGINWNRTFRNGMQHEKDRLAPLHAALLKCVEALESCESRVAHIENWHRDNVTPDNFADCQDVGVTPERYLRDTKLSARQALTDLRKALEECK